MKLKSCALSFVVASFQLLFGFYQNQLKAGVKAGECFRVRAWFPADTFCKDNCTGGSGSCFSSYQKKYNYIQLRECVSYQSSGFVSCEPGKPQIVGTKWKCTTEVNTKGLIECIAAAGATGLGIWAAATSTGGTVVFWGMSEGTLLGLGGASFSGVAAWLGCEYCSTHNCVISRFSDGEPLEEVVSVNTSGVCPQSTP